jgi:hypothetical protein
MMTNNRLKNDALKYVSALTLTLLVPTLAVSADRTPQHLFLCRSPLLAFDFWQTLQSMRQRGVKLTPKIAEEVCNNMRAGDEPQCLRVEAADFKPIASGADGALAMSDGKTKDWFNNPASGGWVHPAYYVSFVNSTK